MNDIIKNNSKVGNNAGEVALAVVTFGISTAWTNPVEPAMKAYEGFPGLKVTKYFSGNQYGGKHFMLEKK